MDREGLERVVVQLLGIAQRCTDVPCERDLMRLANDLVHLIEGSKQTEEAQQSHYPRQSDHRPPSHRRRKSATVSFQGR
jgi:hypothetical protein